MLKWLVGEGARIQSSRSLLVVEDAGNIVYMFAAPCNGALGTIRAPRNMRISSGAAVAW